MLKMMTYLEANAILESSLSPYNYCICKKTALDNGADPNLINSIVPNAEYNRLLPPEAIGALTITPTTYTIRFLDYDNTVLKTQSLQAGATPTPPSNPTRSGYTFSGWSPTVATVTLNLDYIATYTQNASSVQYHIIFAEGKIYSTGFYFYMNNGTFVSISDTSNINSNDIQCIAYLSDNAANSFLIDKNESSASVGYTTDINMYSSYSANVYTNRSLGYGAVLQYMLNSPVVLYCSTTFNGDGLVPSTSQLRKMLNNIDDVNAALLFIGGTPLKTNTDVGSNSDEWYYRMQNKYWSYEAEFESEDSTYFYGMLWVGGYSQYVSRQVTDPQTHITTTELYYVPTSYQDLATSHTITAFVRAIKPINVTAPETPTGTVNGTGIYYEYDVNAGVTPSCPAAYEPQDYSDSDGTNYFNGWTPQLYAATQDQIYVAKWRYVPSGVDPSTTAIYAKGSYDTDWIPSGGTIKVAPVTNDSISILWTGEEPSSWDVGRYGSTGQHGYNNWGSGYINNIDFTNATLIQLGTTVSYYVTGGNPISGTWNVEVHTTG